MAARVAQPRGAAIPPHRRMTRRHAGGRDPAPLVLVAVGATAFWLATRFDRMPPILKRGMQPADFPQLVAGLIVCLALLLWLRPTGDAPPPVAAGSWGAMLLLALFAPLAVRVDFFLALALVGAALARLFGERRPARLALVGLVLPASIFLLFDRVFAIRFPHGVLTALWYG